MDRRERYSNLEETVRSLFESLQARIWTCLPGIIQSYNAVAMTCVVQPGINGLIDTLNGNGVLQSKQMPEIEDCPVVFPQGGGVTLTFPVKAGDECLVYFSARCIDAWWQAGWQGGPANNPPDIRMHNLSDGFVQVGVRSQPRVLSAVSTSSVQMRSDDGSMYWDFNPTTKILKAVCSGGINLNGVTIDSSGNLVSPSTVTGQTQVVAGSGGTAVHLSTHVHPAGSPDTGAPVPGT